MTRYRIMHKSGTSHYGVQWSREDGKWSWVTDCWGTEKIYSSREAAEGYVRDRQQSEWELARPWVVLQEIHGPEPEARIPEES